jgi:hypothetical protein
MISRRLGTTISWTLLLGSHKVCGIAAIAECGPQAGCDREPVCPGDWPRLASKHQLADGSLSIPIADRFVSCGAPILASAARPLAFQFHPAQRPKDLPAHLLPVAYATSAIQLFCSKPILNWLLNHFRCQNHAALLMQYIPTLRKIPCASL